MPGTVRAIADDLIPDTTQPQTSARALTEARWQRAVFNRPETRAAYLAAVLINEQIAAEDPAAPDVRALLDRHLEFSLAQTPREHSFALDVAGLRDTAITLFSFRASGDVLGVGAIKRLDPHHAEIKSMHTAQAARGQGIGRAILSHLLGVARTRGFSRVSLETGTTEAFGPARALYESVGFVTCGPFAAYKPSAHNVFMTLEFDGQYQDHRQS